MGTNAFVFAVIPVAHGGAGGTAVPLGDTLIAGTAREEHSTQVQVLFCGGKQIQSIRRRATLETPSGARLASPDCS